MRKLQINQSPINRDDADVLKLYFNDLNRESTINAEEEVSLARRIKENDNAALRKLVRANLKFVISVAKQYKNRNIPLNDLINEGNIGLIKAAYKFDETKGFKFISYAVWWIRQSILQAINNYSKMVRIPANKIGHQNQIKKVYSSFEQQKEREPTAEEIAEILEQDPSDIYNSLYAEVNDTSLDTPVDDEEINTLYDILENKTIDATDHKLEYKQSLKQEILRALSVLDERERKIIMMSFGINHDHAMNFKEIGDKIGLTRERVRQIRQKALSKLKSKHIRQLLKEFCAR